MIPIGTNLRLKNIPAVTISLIAINCYVFVFETLFANADVFAPGLDMYILYLR